VSPQQHYGYGYSYHWQIHWCGSETCWARPAQPAGWRASPSRAAGCTWSKWSWPLRSGAYWCCRLWSRAALGWRAVQWLQVECLAWRVGGVSGSVRMGEGGGPVQPGAAGCGAWFWGRCPCWDLVCHRAPHQGLLVSWEQEEAPWLELWEPTRERGGEREMDNLDARVC